MTPVLVANKLTGMPDGEYYVGDPCYAFSNDARWMGWLEAANYTEPRIRILYATLQGQPVVGVNTAHGDGAYTGSDGFEYGVDAGLIGVVPVSVAEDNALWAMRKVTFDSDFDISWDDEEGTITIGDITIPTDDWPDE